MRDIYDFVIKYRKVFFRGEFMTISKTTELGTITVSNLIFAQIIEKSFQQKHCRGRVWPATSKGRQIGNEQKFSLSDFAHEINVEPSENGDGFELEFSIIIRFGTSIKLVTGIISDYIAETIEKKQGRKPDRIIIKIAGMKSRQIAKRNLEVIKEYGIKG